MAILTIQHTNVTGGLNPTFSNAAAGGDAYPNTGVQTLEVKNSTSAAVTVTITAQTACNQGTLHAQAFSIPAAATLLLGPFAAQFYNDTLGNVNCTYSTTFQPPPGAPATALGAGTYLGIGVYRYAVTFVTASGETTAGTEISVTTTSGNQLVTLTGLPIGPGGTTQRKIYRTSVGGAAGSEKLLATIADNTTVSYVDAVPDGSLGAVLPASNTAGIAPPGAAAVATAAGTTLGVGAYRYQVTFVNAGGETTGGVEFTITTTTSNTNVNLTSIPTGPTGTTQRKIYRTAVGGAAGTEKLVTTIADNTTTTFTDNVADASLGVAIPTSNTAVAVQVAATAP
jgi:hypothetical protein